MILCGGEVKEERTDEWAWGEASWEEFAVGMSTIDQWWGEGDQFWQMNPSTQGDEAVRRWWSRVQTNAMNPSAAVEFMRMGQGIDVRQILPAVKVPTVIIHRSEDPVCHLENGRHAAAQIGGATYVELPGGDHAPWVNGDEILAEIQEFLTGTREPAEPTRILQWLRSPHQRARRMDSPSAPTPRLAD